ncbi:MAG: SpoIIE family protein phosphatase [Acidobacteriota bacterium]
MSLPWSNKRFWVLALLAVTTVLYRGADIYRLFFSADVPRMVGLATTIDKGQIVVDPATRDTMFGQPSPAALAGLKGGDRIHAVYNEGGEGKIVKGVFDYGAALLGIKRHEWWTLVVMRPAEGGELHEVSLRIPPGVDRVWGDFRVRTLALLFSVILPLIAFVTALFIGFARLDSPIAFRASLLFFCLSTISDANFALFPPILRDIGLFYTTALNTFLSYYFLTFFLVFPSPSAIDRRFPRLKQVALWVSVCLFLISVAYAFLMAHDLAAYSRLAGLLPRYGGMIGLFTLLMLLVGLASLTANTIKADNKDEKRRMVILLAGTLVGLVPLAAFVICIQVRGLAAPSWWMLVLVGCTVGVFPLSFIYVVLRHRVLGIRLILHRGLSYAFVSRGFLAVEAAVIFVIFFFAGAPLFYRLLPDASNSALALATAVGTLGALLVLQRINRTVMPAIDRRFFREVYNARQVLTELSRNIRRMVPNPGQLVRTVTDTISDSFLPEHAALFLRGNEAWTLILKEDGSLHGPPSFNPRNRGGFHLCWVRFRSESPEDDKAGGRPLNSIVLPADSFLIKALSQTPDNELNALDVYLADPKSWAAPIATAGPENRRLYQERLFLESMRSRLIVPLATHDQILGFVSLGEKLSEEPYSREDKELLLAVAEQMAIGLDYAHLVGQAAEQERLRRELEIAKQVQLQLFPQTQPRMRTIEYSALCRPAREVGGDYYDFLQLDAENLCLALGDISGKGLSASLLMASLQALMRSQAPLRGYSPAALISDINRLMCNSTDGSKYATFFCSIYNDKNRNLTFVNAGHNPPMLFRRGGLPASGGDACRLLRLSTGGTVVGIFPGAGYEQEVLTLCPGDVLVVFTDGVTEAFNAENEEFGEERLASVVRSSLHLSCDEIRDRIVSEIDNFVADAPQHDDLTLLVLRVTA